MVRATLAQIVATALLLLPASASCADESTARRERAWVSIAGETFTLELALDPATRTRGLSGRASVPRNGGILFVLPAPRPFAMVMRDCPVPIDVAFLDATGTVVAVHEMPSEPPRRPDESPFAYERRLPQYASGVPVPLAIEVAGGRLRELGVQVGDRIALDVQALMARAR